eukprot:m.166431 g.166431  ORF g.166431 m.166431 type:complete len:67 (+) comp18160_c1_seq8:459-659(+)
MSTRIEGRQETCGIEVLKLWFATMVCKVQHVQKELKCNSRMHNFLLGEVFQVFTICEHLGMQAPDY